MDRQTDMTYTVIIPSIGTPLLQQCLDSMSESVRKNTIVFTNGRNIPKPNNVLEFVDNNENIGLARAWNYGRKHVIDNKQDYLIICSQTVEFTEGMTDFIDFIEDRKPKYGCASTVAWHLIALSREVLESTGEFDTNFYPIYYEDTDYIFRMRHLGLYDGNEWGQCNVKTKEVENAKSLKLGLNVNMEACRQYMKKKWGTDALSGSNYSHPFNNPNNSIDYFEHKSSAQLLEGYGYLAPDNAYRLYLD